MASDNILNELWELTQKNNKEELDEKSFKEDFSNSIYAELKKFSEELTNISDEVNRTLLIILKQAEVNPQVLGNSNGKEFSISSSIIAKAVKTVKYENRFIPGTAEYDKKELQENGGNLKEVILTSLVISKMLENYDDLSDDERKKIVDNFSELSYEEKSEFFKANQRMAKRFSENTNLSKEEQEFAKEIEIKSSIQSQLNDALNDKDENKIKMLLEKFPDFKEKVDIYRSKNPDATLQEACDKLSQNSAENIYEGNAILQRQAILKTLKNLLAQKDANIEEINSCKEYLNTELEGEELVSFVAEEIKKIEKEIAKKRENDKNKSFKITKSKSDKELNSEINGAENLGDFNLYENTVEEIVEDKIVQQQFSEQDISEALTHYQEYFQDFDDEMIVAMSEMTPEEIIANIKDDFDDMQNEGEITEEVRKSLNVMLENITEETKDILLDPEKRDAFFEKVQSDIESQKDTELIKDSELIEIFKQASVDLEVGEMQEERVEEVQDNSALLENAHMDTEYIVNGVAMNIDEQWLQFFQDAQERGEDLEEAYENYKKEQEIEEIEARTEQEDKKEDKAQEEQEQEAVIIEEDGTVRQPAEEETELAAETLEVEGNEFFDLTDVSTLKNSKKSKRVAVVEKDEAGNLTNVQIFKPIEFFKQNEVTTHEFEETISELTALTVDKSKSDVEKENEEEIGQE